ncbi:TetR/AcrR family transcriptional regulator [soil metagenome]
MSAATLIERAFAGAADAPKDATSERILDAALDLVAASGLRALTMDDVAARAGVGRMTVYRRFGERERLIDALAAREARRCIAELDRAVEPDAPVADAIAQGFAASLRLIREHPVLARLSQHEPQAALAALNADGGAILALGRAFVAGRIREAMARGEVDSDLAPEATAELLVRLGFSFLVMPSSVVPLEGEGAAKFARARIAPILGS